MICTEIKDSIFIKVEKISILFFWVVYVMWKINKVVLLLLCKFNGIQSCKEGKTKYF